MQFRVRRKLFSFYDLNCFAVFVLHIRSKLSDCFLTSQLLEISLSDSDKLLCEQT